MPYLTDYIRFIQRELDHSDLMNYTARLNICINCEHNLVCPGFTENHHFQKGTIPLPNKKDNYLVRIENFKSFIDSDIYIEYSQPNIFNIKNSIYNKYLNKIIYIPPLLCEYSPENDKKNIDILTCFYRVFGRRQVLFNNLNNCFSSYINIQNTFGIHVRGGDIKIGNIDPRDHRKYVSPETFFPIIDKILDHNNNQKFFLSCENLEDEELFINRYNKNNPIILGSCTYNRNTKKGVISGFINIILLSKCTKIFGMTSSFSGIAIHISDLPISKINF